MKFQYIFRLVDMVSDNINDAMMERFHDYTQDLSQLTGSMARNQVDKDQILSSLQASALQADEISGLISKYGDQLDKTVNAGLE